MNAITTYERGQIKFAVSLSDLVDAIPREERDGALQAIASDDAVIRHVMDQVLTGCTQDGSSGFERFEDWRLDYGMPSALEMARRAVIGFAPQLFQRYVEKMRRTLEHMRQRVDEYRDEACKAENAVREAKRWADARAEAGELLRSGLEGELARYRDLVGRLNSDRDLLFAAGKRILAATDETDADFGAAKEQLRSALDAARGAE